MATLLLIVIYLAFIGLGLPDSLLGSAWPVMHGDLGVPVSLAGVATLVVTGGTVISSLVSERLIKRFGTGGVTAVSVGMTGAALLGVSASGHFALLLLLCVPLGLGAGTVDAALNNFVAMHYQTRHMNWLHCFWGIGASMSPLVMSFYLARGHWRGAYHAVALTLGVIAGLLLLSLPAWKRIGGEEAAAVQGRKPVPKKTLLGLPGAWLSCLGFFSYSALEFSAGLWASSYFVNVRMASPEAAASWASAFYIGITGGRLLSGFAAIRLKDTQLIRIGTGALVLGVGILLLPLSDAFAVAGLMVMGLGCAPVFPCMLDQTPALFGREYSQGMMGLQMAGAYVGGTLMPPLFGWLTTLIGLKAWPLYLGLILAALVVSTRRIARLPRHEIQKQSSQNQ